MVIITDTNGNSLPLMNVDKFERKRGTNGNYEANLKVRRNKKNSKAFDLIEGQSIITVGKEQYKVIIIDKYIENNTPVIEASALHILYNMTHDYQYDIIKGEKVLTLHQALSHALEPTDYTFIIKDEFDKVSLEDFGDDSSVALFNDLKKKFDFEFSIENKHFTIVKRLGKDTKQQMRWKHNIKAIKMEDNTSNLSTYINGYGKPKEDKEGNVIEGEYVVQTEYTSPNAKKYGILHAKPYYNEKITHKDTLLQYLKNNINDEPELTFEIEYDELSKNIITKKQSTDLGDSIYLIHEPMNIQFKTRIVEVIDYPLHPHIKPKFIVSSKPINIANDEAMNIADKQNQQDDINKIKRKQNDLTDGMSEVVEAVADVNNRMVTVNEEMERIEYEVIPEVEQAIDETKIPSQIEPPYPIPVSKLWWDTSVNPPRLKRWDGNSWIPLANTEEEIDALIEQMKNEAIVQGKEYTEQEIDVAKQEITKRLTTEIGDVNSIITDLENTATILTEQANNTDLRLTEQTEKVNKIDSNIGTIKTDLASKVDGEWVDGRIATKADADSVYTISDIDGKFDNVVSKTDYSTDKDGFVDRFESNETRITQTETDLSKKVEQTTFNQLSDDVGNIGTELNNAKTSIEQNANSLKSKASKSTVNTLSDTVNNHTSTLTQQADLLESKVDNTQYTKDINGVNTKISNHNTLISQNANNIQSKASQAEVDNVKGTVSNHTSTLTQHANKLNTKLDSSVYTKDKTGILSSIKKNTTDIEATVKGLELRVTKEEFDDLTIGGRNLFLDPDSKLWFTSNNGTSSPTKRGEENGVRWITGIDASSGNFYLSTYFVRSFKTGKGSYFSEYAYPIPEVMTFSVDVMSEEPIKINLGRRHYITLTPGVWTRLSYTTKKVVERPMGLYAPKQPEIPVGTKVYYRNYKIEKGNKATDWSPAPEDTQSQINNATERISKTEATLITHADQITAKASKSDLLKKVDTSVYNEKVGQLTTSINGISGRVSNTETNIDNLTGDLKSAKSQIASLDVKADGITQKVSDVRADLDGLEIGGTNLLLNSEDTVSIDNSFKSFDIIEDSLVNMKGKSFVLSFEARSLDGEGQVIRVYTRGGYTTDIELVDISTSWNRYEIVFNLPSENVEQIAFHTGGYGATYFHGQVRRVKLEKGNKATDYSPAIEDTDARITSAEGEISTLAGEVKLRATKTSVDSLTNRMTKAESELKVLPGQISAKVSKDGVVSSINLTPETAKIKAARVDIVGLVSFMNDNGNLLPMHPSNWENGFISITDGTNSDRDHAIRMSDYLTVEPNTEYTLNNIAGSNIFIREYEEGGYVNNHPYLLSDGNHRTFTTGANSRYLRLYWSNSNVSKINPNQVGVTYKATLVKGSKPLSWQNAQTTLIQGGRIVTNNITANKLNVNEIFGNSAVIAEIQARSVKTATLSATKIQSGTLDAAKISVKNLSASSIMSGTLDATKVNVQNLNASSIKTGVLSSIDIRGGVLRALNNNTCFDLNKGKLSVGNGADIEFLDVGNRIVYERYDSESGFNRTSGIGVSNALNRRFPVVYMGTTGTGKESFSMKDENYFTGFIANTNKRETVDGIGNSVVGYTFHVREKAMSYSKGFTFELRGSRPTLRGMNADVYNYELGADYNRFYNTYTDRISGNGLWFNYHGSGSKLGYRMEMTVGQADGNPSFRPQYANEHYYNLGSSIHKWSYIHLRNQPIVNSDERLKEDIADNTLGLDFINDISTKTFRLKPIGNHTEKQPTQLGVVAQGLKVVLKNHGVDTQDCDVLTQGADGMYSVQYGQLIAPTIKAVQELDTKVNNIMRDNASLYDTGINNSKEIDNLKEKNEQLRKRIEQLEQLIS